jgi:hypothetical protein
MKDISIEGYKNELTNAVQHFWDTRNSQLSGRTKAGQGNRSAVTGGKQLDGFINLLVKVAKDIGVPDNCIYVKANHLPGFFRPTKDWDFVIISPSNQLIAVVEFKSQVGSFGNNFNNRTEEALGSSVDLWTAFRENGFPQNQPPWVGYMLLIEKTKQSTTAVKTKEPYFEVRPEFRDTSYLDRYAVLCQKLMLERHYSATSLIWTNPEMEFGSLDKDISIETFLRSFMGFLQGKLNVLQA